MALTIRRRLTFGTLFLFALLLLSAGLGIFQLNRLKQDAQAILEDNYETVRYVQGMQRAFQLGDAKAFEEQLVLQEANITETNEGERTAAVRRDLERWKASGSAPPVLHDDLQTIMDLNLEAIDRKNKAALNTAQEAQQWLWGIAALTLIVGLAFSLAFPRLVTGPIARLRQAVEQVAKGNYRHRVPTFRSDELGSLSHAFNNMSAELERWQNSNLALIMAEKSRVEAVLNSLQDAALGVDNEGRVLFANRKASELLGLGENELVGQAIPELILRNDLLRHVLSEGEGRPFKAVLDGKEQFFASSHSTIRSAQGELGTVHILHNITPFQERDAAKSHFLATISHELKTPLASTDIGLNLLERSSGEPLSEEQRAILTDLRKDHQRLVKIVSELLDAAQLESGRMRLNMVDHPLHDLIQRAIGAVKTQVREQGILLQLDAVPDELNVRADAEKAVWVLVNMLVNGIHHSPTGGQIHVRLEHEGEYVIVRIQDEGPGIPADMLPHLFERFARSREHAPGSTGLGSAISREIMEGMSGQLTAANRPEGGAEFVLRFRACTTTPKPV